jgi:hypothetical protein
VIDLRGKVLVVWVVLGIVIAFAHFSTLLAALAGIASLPFLLTVLTQ